ncbi:hypothetical protein KDW85_27175 [Burkholderia cenocepacia]|uniref:hypothetical protein n=1 Tax=Burkholderia cenocepacia TaxID=95486 RepID=UPI001B9BC633|nr:hypothetical protein [Burkholderia cenocepacia]MBR8042088.1 hypothetical protein [Burkholderia cenocepacia]
MTHPSETHPDDWLTRPDAMDDVRATARHVDDDAFGWNVVHAGDPVRTVEQVFARWGHRPSDPHYAGMRRRLGFFSEVILLEDWAEAKLDHERRELSAAVDQDAHASEREQPKGRRRL